MHKQPEYKMTTNRIGILSDVHLGFRQYGLEERWIDFNNAFTDALQKFQTAGIQHVLIAGDLLHQSRPTARTMAYLKQLDDWLQAVGIHLYVVRGNHDYTTPHWLEVLRNPATGPVVPGFNYLHKRLLKIAGKQVYFLGYCAPDEFRHTEFPAADILVCHQSVAEFVGFNSSYALTFDELPCSSYQLIVVGDTHIPEQVNHNGCTIISPGSTEMNTDAEPVEKYGYVLDTLDMKLTPYPLTTRTVIRNHKIRTSEDLKAFIETLKGEKPERCMVSVRYARDLAVEMGELRDYCVSQKIIYRAAPLPELVGKQEVQTTFVVDRGLVDIANEEVSDEDVRDLLLRVINKPEETSDAVDDWLHLHLSSELCEALDAGKPVGN